MTHGMIVHVVMVPCPLVDVFVQLGPRLQRERQRSAHQAEPRGLRTAERLQV